MLGLWSAFAWLAAVIDSGDTGADLILIFAGILAGMIPIAIIMPSEIRSYFRTLQGIDRELREHMSTSDRVRIIGGEIHPLCSPSQLLFSPITHRACVAWSVVTVLGRSPWHAHGAMRTSVTVAIPFRVTDEAGPVRVEVLESILIPRLEGLARMVRRSTEEIDIVSSFYEARDVRGYQGLSDVGSARSELMTTYELIIPPSGWVTLVAAAHRNLPDTAGSAPGTTVHIEAARAFVGTPAEVNRIIRKARSRALRWANTEIALGLVITTAALLYAGFAHHGYLN